MLFRHRILQGDVIALVFQSSIVAEIEGDFRVVYDDGSDDIFHVPRATTGAVRLEEFSRPSRTAVKNGYVVSGVITAAQSLKRGQTYVLGLIRTGGPEGPVREILMADYVYATHPIPLDVVVGQGPEGGGGNFVIEAIADDVTPVDIAPAMAATNALRRVYGFAWYYNCAAEVANRTLITSVNNPLGAVPTGFTQTPLVWTSATITLTTGEEGWMYGKKNFVSYNDNGTLTYASTNTAANPFPLWVHEDDPIDFLFDVDAAHADDRHSIYIYYEEWLNF